MCDSYPHTNRKSLNQISALQSNIFKPTHMERDKVIGPRATKEPTFPHIVCFRRPTPPPPSRTAIIMADTTTTVIEMNANHYENDSGLDAVADKHASEATAANDERLTPSSPILSRAPSVANSVASSCGSSENKDVEITNEPQMPDVTRKVVGTLRVKLRQKLENEKAARPIAGSSRARRAAVMAKVQAELQRQSRSNVKHLPAQEERLLGPATRSGAPPVFQFGTDEHAVAQRIDRDIMDALARARLEDALEQGADINASDDGELDQMPALRSLAQSVFDSLNIKWESINEMRNAEAQEELQRENGKPSLGD